MNISGKKKVQLTLLWTFHRKRTASSCVSTWRSLMKSDLLGFEVVWWIEQIIFQQLYHYLLFNCLSILNGLLEMPGSCCKFWSHLCFQVQSHLAHSLQPKKCSMKPCIAFSTSLGKNPFYILVKLAWLLNRLKSSEHLFPIIKSYLKPWISSMSCCLADGQRVPETPQATGVTTIPDHRTEMNMWRDTFILFLQSEYL